MHTVGSVTVITYNLCLSFFLGHEEIDGWLGGCWFKLWLITFIIIIIVSIMSCQCLTITCTIVVVIIIVWVLDTQTNTRCSSQYPATLIPIGHTDAYTQHHTIPSHCNFTIWVVDTQTHTRHISQYSGTHISTIVSAVPAVSASQLLQSAILSLQLSECVPTLIPSTVTSRPTAVYFWQTFQMS